jgi:hypothetical protein
MHSSSVLLEPQNTQSNTGISFSCEVKSMRIMERKPGILDGVMVCSDCNCPMVKIGHQYRCINKAEPEELVASGFIPIKDASGKLMYQPAKDQQELQTTQALSHSVEIDNAYLEQLGLNVEKIREHQIKLDLLP